MKKLSIALALIISPLLANADVTGYGSHSGDGTINCQVAKSNALLDASGKIGMLVESNSQTISVNGDTSSKRVTNQQSLSKLKVISTDTKEGNNKCEVNVIVDDSSFKQIDLGDYERNNEKIRQYISSNGSTAYDFKTSSSLTSIDNLTNVTNSHLSTNISKKLPNESDQEFTNRVVEVLVNLVKQNAVLYVSEINTVQYQGIDLSVATVNWYIPPHKAIEIFKLLQRSGIGDKIIMSQAMDHVRIKHDAKMYNFMYVHPEGIVFNTPHGKEEIEVFYNRLGSSGLYTLLNFSGKHEFVLGAVMSK